MTVKGNKEKTTSGAHRSDLMKNKRNKVGKLKTGPSGHDQSVLYGVLSGVGDVKAFRTFSR